MNNDDLELIVKRVVAEFNNEFFYTSTDNEDQEIMLENLAASERYVAFVINRFIEMFNEKMSEEKPVNIVINQDEDGEQQHD